jgi:hypothetical protein
MTTFPAVLAAGGGDAIAAVVIVIITIVGWIVKLANAEKPRLPPVSNRPRPQPKPRDARVAQEINVFLEDNTGARNRPARPSPPPRPQPASNQASRRQQQQTASKGKRKARPGEDLSKRQAPVAENLGGGVSQHLRQHMVERIEKGAEQRVTPRTEERVTADLGAALATADSPTAALLPSPQSGKSPAERFAELLRNPAGMQQAVVMNLILSRPPGLNRSQRP